MGQKTDCKVAGFEHPLVQSPALMSSIAIVAQLSKCGALSLR